MGVVRFIADLHLSHENMAKRRGFSSKEEHDEHIITEWNKVVDKRDVTYILGDITRKKKTPYPLLHCLELNYQDVRGNIHGHIHDKEVGDSRYFCVSCERVNYKPITLEELIK